MAGELTDCAWELHKYNKERSVQQSIEYEESFWEAERRGLGRPTESMQSFQRRHYLMQQLILFFEKKKAILKCDQVLGNKMTRG